MGDQDLGLVETVGPFWSADEVAERLGTTHASGAVLCVTTADGVPLYPVSQFVTLGGRTVVAPGIADMLRNLDRFDGWTVAVLLETPADELNGVTPLAWAKQGGDPGTLVDLAHQVVREWSAR